MGTCAQQFGDIWFLYGFSTWCNGPAFLGKGPLVSWTPGDLHWGLVVPVDTVLQLLDGVWCLGPAILQRTFTWFVTYLGMGPHASLTPGDVHWGLGVPILSQCGLLFGSSKQICPGEAISMHSTWQRGGWVAGLIILSGPGHVPSEPEDDAQPDCTRANALNSYKCPWQRGGWVAGSCFTPVPGHVPSAPEATTSPGWHKVEAAYSLFSAWQRGGWIMEAVHWGLGVPILSQCGLLSGSSKQVCPGEAFSLQSTWQRGGWVAGLTILSGPGHVPSEPEDDAQLDWTRAAALKSYKCPWQRGGWVAGSCFTPVPGHVPSAPEATTSLGWHKVEAAYCLFSAWQRGGWIMEAVLLSISSHVPSEPKLPKSREALLVTSSCMDLTFPQEHAPPYKLTLYDAGRVAPHCAWFHKLILSVEDCMPRFGQFILSWWSFLLFHSGLGAATFFRTLCLVGLVYQGRLLAFSLRLKGGLCNHDALIRFSRKLCGGPSWSCGLALAAFSPSQDDRIARQHRRSSRRGRIGISRDCILLLLLLASLFGRASAGSGRFDGQDPTSFRSTRRARKRCGSLIHLRHIARNLDSPTSSESDTDDPTIFYYFRIFAVGTWPEVMVREFRVGVGVRIALDLLEVDSQVARISPLGHLVPARGNPIQDFVPAIWVPHWTQHVQGAVLLVDASLIGHGLFVWFPFRFLLLSELAALLAEIWDEGIFAFSLYHSQRHLDEDSRFLARDGVTISLQRDPRPQYFHANEFESFSTYRLWGRDMENQDDPPDLEWGNSHIQLTTGADTLLISVGDLDLDQFSLRRVALRFSTEQGALRLQTANAVPERLTFCGVPVRQMVFSDANLEDDAILVVFLNLRGIGRDGYAATIRDIRFSAEELIAELLLDIPAVSEFRTTFQGGRRQAGRWSFRDGDVISFAYVPLDASDNDLATDSSPLTSSEADDVDESDVLDPELGDSVHTTDSGLTGDLPEGNVGAGDGAGSVPGSAALALGRAASTSQKAFLFDRVVLALMVDLHFCSSLVRIIVFSDAALFTLLTSIAYMWNHALFDLGVFVEDRRGDTSALAVGFYSSHTCWRKVETLGGSLPCLFSSGTDSQRLAGRHVQGWGLRLVCFSFLLLLDGAGATASTPATFHDYPCDPVNIVLPVHDEDVGHDTFDSFPYCRHLATAAVWICPDDTLGESDRALVDWKHICTALEDGKGPRFRDTCMELGLFIDSLDEGTWPCKAPAKREPAACKISIADALGAAADEAKAICGRPGLCPLPPSWSIPLELFQNWDEFALLRQPSDFTDCELHCNSRWALQEACGPCQPVQQGWDLHFYTDGSALGDSAGWAVVILANHCAGGSCKLIGCFGGPLDGAEDLGVSSIDALQAEQTALCWALLWTLPQIHVLAQSYENLYFCWDCMSAGEGASGDCNLASTPLAMPLRGLYALVDRLSSGSAAGRHVKAHEGHPWNELADTLANAFRKGKPRCGDLGGIAEAFRKANWAWAPVANGDGLPRVVTGPHGTAWSDVGHTGPAHVPTGLIPLQSSPKLDSQGDGSPPLLNSFSLKAVSANLQGIGGKHRYLEAQLCDAEVDFAFFQETKAKGGAFSSAAYHRFATEHEGHWGTAIWIRRFVTLNGCLCAIKPSDCRVLVSEPRLLAISLRIAGSSVLLISVHLPQQSHGHEARAGIFEHLRRTCDRVKHPAAIFLGADANARVPCGFDPVSGNIEFGEDDAFGYEFVQLLSELDLWIPATFADCHSGPSGTWRHSSGIESRIDFLCIGRGFVSSQLSTWVASDLDLLNLSEDHSAIALQGIFVDSRSSPQPAHLLRRRYDTAKMQTPAGKVILRDSLAGLWVAPWGADVNLHAAALEEATHAVLQKHFAVHHGGPRSAYISDYVWQVRGRRNHLKTVTRFWKEGHKTALLREGFNRLAQRGRSTWWKQVDLFYHLFAAAVRTSTEWIKRHIRKDKLTLLRNIADGGGGHTVQDIQRALRRCGLGRKFVGRHGRPLPLLLDEQGQAVSSRDALDGLWLRHFACMEAGRCVDVHSFGTMVQRLTPPVNIRVDFDLLPSFIDVEDQFRRVRCGAASGLDGLPPEVFKAAPQHMARLFHPLMVKAALNLIQPVQWRGGILFEAYKRSGSPASVESYRSLFVSSVPGKCYHRILRNRAAGLVEDTLGSLHCGGRKGRPVTLPSFAAQLISRAHKTMRHSLVTLFLDTKSAYYRVVRELAFGSLEEDREVVALFRRFSVPASDLEQLMDLVHSGGIMATTGMSEHLRALVQDIHALSWFVTPYTDGKSVALSRAGSRPGESWADLVFAFVYHKVLEGIKHSAVHEGFILQIPFSGERSPFTLDGGESTIQGPLHATWADDSVFFTADPCADVALQKARQLAKHVLDQCERHGMEPNLKKGKSAVILAIRGRNSRTVKRDSFADDTTFLDVPMSDERTVKICLEVQYTHLGTILHRDGSMMPEARLRLGIAAAAYKKYDKLILSNAAVDWETRRHFFDSLVGGVFFNLALWTPDCKGWHKIESGYAMLLRGLLKAHRTGDEFFLIRGNDIPALLDVADLATICRMRRLAFLASLVAVGDDCIWAVLQLEGTWSKQICNDLCWLWRHVDMEVPFPSKESWHLWSQFILDQPRRFRSLISKAGNRSRQQLRLETLTMRTLRFLGEWEAQHAQRLRIAVAEPFWCGPCGRWFRKKAALASHFFQIHGRVSNYRHVAFGTECQACGKHFQSNQQLSLHLRVKISCCNTLSARGLWQRCVLPGIGSSVWNTVVRANLGLSLPSDAIHKVAAIPADDHVWAENPDLLMALLGGIEAMLSKDDSTGEQQFRFCLHLTDFPLFFEEMMFVAGKAELVLQELDLHVGDHLTTAVRDFFHGEVEQQLDFDMGEAALSDAFWRPVALPRPSWDGSWITVADTISCALLCPDTATHVNLLCNWHDGDWPPGKTHEPWRAASRPPSATALRHLLQVLTTTRGWLRAHSSFWESDLSIPFLRFHHAGN